MSGASNKSVGARLHAWASSFGPLLLLVGLVMGLSQAAQYWQAEKQGQVLRERAKPGDILMISSEHCVYCTQARNWLNAQQVAYRECFIEQDADCMAQYRAHMAAGTPTFVLRGQHRVLGFDKERIAQLLAQS